MVHDFRVYSGNHVGGMTRAVTGHGRRHEFAISRRVLFFTALQAPLLRLVAVVAGRNFPVWSFKLSQVVKFMALIAKAGLVPFLIGLERHI